MLPYSFTPLFLYKLQSSANTMIMKKTFYRRMPKFLIALLCLSSMLYACKTQPNVKVQTSERITYYTPSARNVEIDENLIPAPTLSEFWSVEDVDVSARENKKKHVAFTFDDAPTRRLPELMSVFLEFNENNPDCKASATIFFNGVNLNEYTLPYVKKAYEIGLELGNHTYSHCDLRKLATFELDREISLVDEFLQKIDGNPLHLLRAPYGAVDDSVRAAAKTPILDWSVDTLDWTGISAEEICQKTLDGLEQGGIVLFHDGAKNTVQAIRMLLPILKEKNYQAVSISQLSKIHTCPLRIGGLYTRARPKK